MGASVGYAGSGNAQPTAMGVPQLDPVHSTPVLVIGVNTTRPWCHKNGEAGSAPIERVARWLAAARPQQLRVVVVHQPAAVTEVLDRPNLLRDLQRKGRPLWVVQAGTAVSSRTRPEVLHLVNIARRGQACCRIERWDLTHSDQGFVCKAVTAIEPDRT